MTTLLLQLSRSRDAADDAALTAAARELSPVDVVAATAHPERTAKMTGLSTVPATAASLFRLLPRFRSVVVMGGRPLSSAARRTYLLGLPELAALAMSLRTSGRPFALVGVGAGVLSSRNDCFLARQLVLGSALTVLDGPGSVAHLVAAGVPAPLRIGSSLAWLELQQPPPPSRTPPDEILFTLTSRHVDSNGGPRAVADRLQPVLIAIADRLRRPVTVAIQGWRNGPAAGDDLDSAMEVASGLAGARLPVRVTPPPATLAAHRDLMGSAAFAISTSSTALMASVAAGVPTLVWPRRPTTAALAGQLGVPLLPADPVTAVADALSSTGPALAAVRQQIAVAHDVADLLKVLLTHGAELPRSVDSPVELSARVRPIGVLS